MLTTENYILHVIDIFPSNIVILQNKFCPCGPKQYLNLSVESPLGHGWIKIQTQ